MYALALVKRDFIPIKDDYEATAYELIETLSRVDNNENLPLLEIEAADLVIRAIEQQIPFIREGIK